MKTSFKITEKLIRSILNKEKLNEQNSYVTWEGCKYSHSVSENLGKVKIVPKQGYAEFNGTINGKKISVEGCFDQKKLILTYGNGEEGQRGIFKGHYYTNDTSQPFVFEGDEAYANNFLYGTLTNNNEINIPEYENNFHTRTWTYSGHFTKEGKLGESNPQVNFASSQTAVKNNKPTIVFAPNDYYYGEFVDSKINGKGVFYLGDSGIKLEGDFKTIDNGEGSVTYSCTTNKGEVIDDIFIYESQYQQNKNKGKDKDKSLGILKKGTLIGKTYFKTKITNKKTKEEKSLNGFLPFTNIELQNINNPKIKYETKSDENGDIKISNFVLGSYEVNANYKENNVNVFILPKIKGRAKRIITVEDEKKVVDLTLYPTKEKQREDNNRANVDFSGFFKNVNSNNYVEFGLETQNAGYEKFLKNSKKVIENYNDKQTKRFCESEMLSYSSLMVDLFNKKITPKMVKAPTELQPTKDFLKSCYMRYKDESNIFDYKKNKDLRLVMNPGNDLYDFKIVLENRDIYNKTNTMSISNSIRKVLKEQSQIKKDLVIEKNIIEKRFQFILKTSDKFDLTENLYKETKQLINNGYNKEIVTGIFRSHLK